MGLNLQSLISPHFFNILYYIKRKQSDYKPGSVRTISQFSTDEACLSFIYSMSHPMAQAFYPPPNNRAGYPGGGGLHELAAPKMHSRHVTVPLVSSYLTFSPFLPGEAVVLFFCITQPSRTASTLGSGMPCAARTFLVWLCRTTSDRPSGCFPAAKVRLSEYNTKEKSIFSLLLSNESTLDVVNDTIK